MAGLFITGTDTGVGKTFVARGIVSVLRARGRRVGVLKPVETGCGGSAARRPEDALALRSASGSTLSLDRICPYQLDAPLAPDVAARLEGVRIDPTVIDAAFCAIETAHDVTVVEGAGGLLVPIVDRYSMADLARDHRPAVACRRRLEARGDQPHPAHPRGRRCPRTRGSGLRAQTMLRRADEAAATNASVLQRCTDAPCLGEIAWTPSGEADPGVVLGPALDWKRLLAGDAGR